jgi:broad specificity phosphatase PhoE
VPGVTFQEASTRFFAHPEEVVFGAESADQALAYISHTVGSLMARASSGDTLLVTLGTVLALYVAAITAQGGTSANPIASHS